jgi:D-apiose dehydrogenase
MPTAEEKRLRVGLIGCGFFATNHLHAWREIAGVELVAVCDRDGERAKAAAAAFGVAAWYTDAERMLASERLDFVDIATTAPSHRPLVELAARHRAHAICQKPFAPTIEDARAMVAACEAAGVRLMVHENFRWQRAMRAVREELRRRDYGRMFFARIGFRSHRDVYSTQPYLATDERFIIADLGVHLLDLARFFLGEMATMSCHTQRVNPRIRGEDVATMHLVTVDGASCVVDASYASHVAEEIFPQTLLRLEGEKGSISIDGGFNMTTVHGTFVERSLVAPQPRPWQSAPAEVIQDSVVAIQRHWVECLRSGRDPETSGADNLRTLELVEAAYRAASTGAIVTLSPLARARADRS